MTLFVITASIGETRPAIYSPEIDARSEGVRYLAFVDRPDQVRSGGIWEVVKAERQWADPCRDAKRFKILARDYLPSEATASLWIDRHCRLKVHPVELFASFSEDLLLVNHWRRCIYHEGRAVLKRRKDDAEIVRDMLDRFRLEGYPGRAGLYFGGFVARRHTPREERFSRLWWHYVANGSRRDQLSLPVAVRRSKITLRALSGFRTFFQIRGK